MRTRLLLAVSLVAVCLVSASCGGGGVTRLPVGDIDLNQAVLQPMPVSPHAGGVSCQDALKQWEIDPPTTREELLQRLELFMGLVQADPDSACAQFGLAIAIFACALHNGADALGYDLIGSVTTASIARGLPDSPYSFDAILQQVAQLTVAPSAAASAQAGTRQLIPGSTLTAEEIQQAIESFVIPPLANCVARLNALLSGGNTSPLLTYETESSVTVDLYAADINLIIAQVQYLRTFLLHLVAYGLDPGTYNWNEDLALKDTNGDDILTVAEYAPSDPFLALRSRQAMVDAGVALRDATARERNALLNQSTDPDSLMNLMGMGGGSPAAEDRLEDIHDILSGQVTFTATYLDGGAPGSTPIAINMSALWNDPIPDVKDLLPPLTIDPSDGSIDADPGDLPDPTFHGLFPGGAFVTLVAAGYDDLVLTYGEVEISL